MVIRHLAFLLALLCSTNALSETVTNYSVVPLALKGPNEAQWNPPEFEKSNGGYKIILSGKAAVGTAVLLPNQKPSVVSPEGVFRVETVAAKLETSIKVHFISADGNVSTFLVKLNSVEKTAQPALGDDDSAPPKFKISEDFKRPLYFDLPGNGVKSLPPKLEYELNPEAGLFLGPALISDAAISFDIKRISDRIYAFVFRWPKIFAQQGNLEVQDAKNNVVWTETMDSSRMRLVERDSTETTTEETTTEVKNAQEYLIYTSNRMVKHQFDFLKNSDNFRFCFKNTQDDLNLTFCSKRYSIREGTWFMRLIPTRKRANPTVEINDTSVPLAGQAVFDGNLPKMKFKSVLPRETTIEFETGLAETDLRDIVLTSDLKAALIAGKEPAPFWAEIQPHDLGWQTKVNLEEPHLFFPGKNGIPFRQDFELTKPLPQERHRAYIDKNKPQTVYSSSVDLDGELQDDYKVRSLELEAQNGDGNEFEWDYQTNDRGTFANSHLLISHKESEYSATTEIYRGFPFEFSTRLTGVATTSGALWLLGEVAGAAWMDNLLGWRNHLLTDRRWGISGRTFRSLAATENRQFEATNAELKYRFTPGLWNTDETIGLVAAYQNVSYQGSSLGPTPATMIGGGLFWARKMPWIFDELFNTVPFFRYPKYVDMQGVYYFQTQDQNVKLSTNFNLEFHGKMFWTPRYFLEASFGFRRLGYSNKSVNRQIEVTLLFGTGGIGINF